MASCLFTCGHIDVLDWLFDNGYSAESLDVIALSVINDRRNVLLWAREHGLAWDAIYMCTLLFSVITCLCYNGSGRMIVLGILTVIVAAQDKGFEDIEQWAIDNGCPTE